MGLDYPITTDWSVGPGGDQAATFSSPFPSDRNSDSARVTPVAAATPAPTPAAQESTSAAPQSAQAPRQQEEEEEEAPPPPRPPKASIVPAEEPALAPVIPPAYTVDDESARARALDPEVKPPRGESTAETPTKTKTKAAAAAAARDLKVNGVTKDASEVDTMRSQAAVQLPAEPGGYLGGGGGVEQGSLPPTASPAQPLGNRRL